MVGTLSFLCCCGWPATPACLRGPRTLTTVQSQSMQRLVESAERFCRYERAIPKIATLVSELDAANNAYSGCVASVRRTLKAEQVIPAWPKLGEAAVCAVVNVVEGALKTDLQDPYQCILPKGNLARQIQASARVRQRT